MQTNHFLRLLDAELACCIEDLKGFEDLLVARLKIMEITEYVFRENDALLKRETTGVTQIRKTVQAMNPDEFASIDEIIAVVRSTVKTAIHDHELPQAVYPLIDRRLLKVQRYVTSGDD